MVIASGLLALLVGAAFVALLVAISNFHAATDVRRDTREELVAAEALQKLVIDIETGLRGFVITREARFLEPFNVARAALPEAADELERVAADDPVGLARARRIVRGATTYVQEYALALVDAVRRDDPLARSVETTDAGRQRVDALRASFVRFSEETRASLDERDGDANQAARHATVAAVLGVAASMILILVFTGYLTRVIVQPLRRAVLMADRVARGDLRARMRETDVAEIGALERSFNVMAGSLETGRDELASLLAEQAALRRVATLVAQGVRPAEIFGAVTEEVGGLVGSHMAGIVRFDADGSGMVFVGVSDSIRGKVGVGSRWELEDAMASAKVLRTGHSSRVDATGASSDEGPYGEALRRLGVASTVACPILVEGSLWGAMVVSNDELLPLDTEQRLANFTELVATAIANAESRAELTASRTRIVTASDHTRRQIERDLHDGLQQRLVSLGLQLGGAERGAPSGIAGPGGDVSWVAKELGSILDDLREISRGIHPAILGEGGLGPALKTLARRSPIPVEVDVPTEMRFAEPIELAAYYAVSEALTNTVKHAEASRVRVTGERRDDTLQLWIRDDGVGGADPSQGSGLIGLKDRVEALGGKISVTSPAGRGTAVHVQLPADAAAVATGHQ